MVCCISISKCQENLSAQAGIDRRILLWRSGYRIHRIHTRSGELEACSSHPGCCFGVPKSEDSVVTVWHRWAMLSAPVRLGLGFLCKYLGPYLLTD